MYLGEVEPPSSAWFCGEIFPAKMFKELSISILETMSTRDTKRPSQRKTERERGWYQSAAITTGRRISRDAADCRHWAQTRTRKRRPHVSLFFPSNQHGSNDSSLYNTIRRRKKTRQETKSERDVRSRRRRVGDWLWGERGSWRWRWR